MPSSAEPMSATTKTDRPASMADSATATGNAPPPAIDLVLAPMVAPFLKACPQIELEIVGDSSFVDIVAAGFDAGVRYGEHLAQDMIAVSLSPPQRYAVVASPRVKTRDRSASIR